MRGPGTVMNGANPDSTRSWLVAVLGTSAMIFTFGTPFSYGVLRDPVGETFGVSPFVLSLVFGVMLFTFFIGAAVVSILSVRLPARGSLLGSALLVFLLAPALYIVESPVGLTLVWSLHGLAVGVVFVTIAGVVPRWFRARRGLATGLIFAGNGLGLFLVPPIWQVTIARFGIRPAFLGVSLATGLTFLLAGIVCRRPGWTTRSTMGFREVVDWLVSLAGTRSFRFLFVGIGFSFLWYLTFAAYAVDLLVTRGFSPTAASVGFGLVGGVSIVSRISSGYIADRAGIRRTFLLFLAVSALGITLLLAPRFPLLVLAVLCMGVGLGGIATLYVPLVMESLTQEKDTAVVGVFNVPIGAVALTAPPMVTVLVNYADSHTPVILLTLVSTLLAFALVTVATR